MSSDGGSVSGIGGGGGGGYSGNGGVDLFPVSFPPDVLSTPGVPQAAQQITSLPHGDVVSAVAIATTNSSLVFTGGKVRIANHQSMCSEELLTCQILGKT